MTKFSLPFDLMPSLKVSSMMVYKGGGGETSTSNTVSESSMQVDDAYQADVDQAMKSLRSQYESGSLGQVAGASALQEEAFAAASGTSELGLDAIRDARSGYSDAMEGTGMFDPAKTDALERAAIDQAAKERGIANDGIATMGAMGGSRSAIAAGDRDAQLTNALAQIKFDQENKSKDWAMWGTDGMTQSGALESQTFGNNMDRMTALGEIQRGITQEELDADAKGLESYITGITAMTDLISTQTSTSTATSESSGGGGK